MTWQEFTALLVLATAMSFSPGPNTTLSAALAANGGLRHAMRFVWAVPALRGGIKAVGVAYLVWLAWKLSGSATLGQAAGDKLQISFRQGVALQFVNIKAWLLALTIIAGWVAGHPDAQQRMAIVSPVMLFFAFASNLFYALVGAVLRSWLAQGKRLLWFNRCMAAILVLTAAWMLKI